MAVNTLAGVTRNQIIKALGKTPKEVSQVASRVGISRHAAYWQLNELVKEHKAVKLFRGVYKMRGNP